MRVPFQARRSSYPKVYIRGGSALLQYVNPINVMMISHATTIVYLLSFTVRFSSAFPGLNHLLLREICYENDILQSFQTWEADSIPYCSSLLGISDYTLFEGPTKTQTYNVLILDCSKHLRRAGLLSRLLRQQVMIP